MSTVRQHPTGLAASGAAVLIIIAGRLGLELSAEEAAVIVGFIGGVVSLFTPRTKQEVPS